MKRYLLYLLAALLVASIGALGWQHYQQHRRAAGIEATVQQHAARVAATGTRSQAADSSRFVRQGQQVENQRYLTISQNAYD